MISQEAILPRGDFPKAMSLKAISPKAISPKAISPKAISPKAISLKAISLAVSPGFSRAVIVVMGYGVQLWKGMQV